MGYAEEQRSHEHGAHNPEQLSIYSQEDPSIPQLLHGCISKDEEQDPGRGGEDDIKVDIRFFGLQWPHDYEDNKENNEGYQAEDEAELEIPSLEVNGSKIPSGDLGEEQDGDHD